MKTSKGSIEKRSEKSYRLTVELGYDSNGERIRERKTVQVPDDVLKSKSKKQLDMFLDDELTAFRRELETGHYIKPHRFTLDRFYEVWNSEYATNPKNLSPTTYEKYSWIYDSRLKKRFGHWWLDDIGAFELVTFLNTLEEEEGARLDGKPGPLSTSAIKDIHKTLNSILKFAVKLKVIKDNPMSGINAPAVTYENKEFYDEDEAYSVLEALYHEPRKQRLMVMGALIGGERRGEINAVKWGQISYEDRKISVEDNIPLTKAGVAVEKGPKSKSSVRKVSYPAWYMAELREFEMEWRGERKLAIDAGVWVGGDEENGYSNDYIFHNGKGKPFYFQYISKWWMKFCKRHELRYITFHELRHSSVTLIIEEVVKQGESPEMILKAIQAQLGHAKYSTTFDIYGHVTKKMSDITAQKMDKFDIKKRGASG